MIPRHMTLLRSVLFAPAVRTDFIRRLPEREADAVVIDCEDATPPQAKSTGRRNARLLTDGLLAAGCQVTVRVNGPYTEWFAADVSEALSPALSAVVVPKIETVGDLQTTAEALDSAGLPHLGVIAGIETALGLADARSLLAHPRVIGAYFGAEDFVADMGGVRTESNSEVLYARSSFALAGRLARVPTLDQVVTDFHNDDRFAIEAAEARALGYSGKLCIHPNQVAIANRGFVPASAEIERAKRLLAAYDEATRAGLSAFEFEGQMVDEPMAVQARRILKWAV